MSSFNSQIVEKSKDTCCFNMDNKTLNERLFLYIVTIIIYYTQVINH